MKKFDKRSIPIIECGHSGYRFYFHNCRRLTGQRFVTDKRSSHGSELNE